MTVRLLVIAPPAFAPLEMLRDVALCDPEDAEVVLVAPRFGKALEELWPRLRSVRWIHTLAAGVEFMPFELLRQSDVVFTNARGLYANALAEFAIASMLWFTRDVPRLIRNQKAHRWEPYTVGALEGQTAGIIGYGGIGQAVGARAEAFGMRVLPVRRRSGDVDDVLAQSDHVVMCTPLTPATRGLMSRARFASMKPSAIFINIGRGAAVDEEALVDALRARTIRGAALDVFEHEPLPPDHPLWQLDNVLLSPHSADHTADAHQRAMRFFLENLDRFRNGEPLRNVVDKREQY